MRRAETRAIAEVWPEPELAKCCRIALFVPSDRVLLRGRDRGWCGGPAVDQEEHPADPCNARAPAAKNIGRIVHAEVQPRDADQQHERDRAREEGQRQGVRQLSRMMAMPSVADPIAWPLGKL